MTPSPFIQHDDVLTCGKEQRTEGLDVGGKGRRLKAIPSTTKKVPEEVPKPPYNTTVKTAKKGVARGRVLKPSERTTTVDFEGAGSKPPASITIAAVPTKGNQGPSSTTRESPPGSGDAIGPGSLVDVKNLQC